MDFRKVIITKPLDFANTSSKILTTEQKTELYKHAATWIARGSLLISFFEKEVTKEFLEFLIVKILNLNIETANQFTEITANRISNAMLTQSAQLKI